jgi:TRAP-type C4-dicarboxylate transport system permease small subunit
MVQEALSNQENLNFSRPRYAKLGGWKGWLQKANERFLFIERALMLFFLILLCTGAFLQWFLRAFFSVGYIWMGDMVKYSMLWSGFLGACLATTRLEHFRIDIVRYIKNPTLKKAVRIVAYLMACLVFAIFTYATFEYLQTLIRTGDRSTYYDYPTWPFYLVVFYFYASSALRMALTALLKA